MVRNIFMLFGIASVFAIVFFFIKPDWIKQISSSPTPQGPGVMTKVNGRLSSERLLAKIPPKDKGGLLQIDPMPNGDDHSLTIVEDVGEDLPSRNTPYMLVINKSTNVLRYCRLSPSVRKATLRGTVPSDVKFQEVANTPGGPYQIIIWVPSAMDLPMEFDLMVNSTPRS
ncbi:MAG: hypothetical protein K8T89_02325 [Planctomycetes bacterium]|nr:hypothetical protein [Planctomycetota bacterium]